MTSVAMCEEAMTNAAIGDDALVLLFRQCVNADGLVESAVRNKDERSLRMLIDEGFLLKMDRFRRNLLWCAFTFSSQRIIDVLICRWGA
jgi:hypothetical protein